MINAMTSPERPRRQRRMLATVIGVGLLIAGLYMLTQRVVQMHGWSVTDGRVVAFIEHQGMRRDQTVFEPVVEFDSPTGRVTFEAGGQFTEPRPAFEVGEAVRVQYDPQDPERATVDAGWRNWLPPAGALVAAAVVLGLTYRRISRVRG